VSAQATGERTHSLRRLRKEIGVHQPDLDRRAIAGKADADVLEPTVISVASKPTLRRGRSKLLTA
jgi:hypothetical protein